MVLECKIDKLTEEEAEIWWEKWMRKDPEAINIATRKANVYDDPNADEYFEIETNHWQDLPNSVRKKLLNLFQSIKNT